MTDHTQAPSKERSSIEDIRARAAQPVTEIVANPREYYRVQQLLRDRADLLAYYDELRTPTEQCNCPPGTCVKGTNDDVTCRKDPSTAHEPSLEYSVLRGSEVRELRAEIERLQHELAEAKADAVQSRGWGEAAIARMGEMQSAPPPVLEYEPLCTAVTEALRHARVPGMETDDGTPYQFVDHMSDKDADDITSGIERIELFAENVTDAILENLYSRPTKGGE
jgi:hypothetical protein